MGGAEFVCIFHADRGSSTSDTPGFTARIEYRFRGSPQGSPKEPREATNATPHPSSKRRVESIVKTMIFRNSHTGSPNFVVKILSPAEDSVPGQPKPRAPERVGAVIFDRGRGIRAAQGEGALRASLHFPLGPRGNGEPPKGKWRPNENGDPKLPVSQNQIIVALIPATTAVVEPTS